MGNTSEPAGAFDPEHWRRFRDRDRSAFEQVFAHYHPKLLAYLAAHYYFPLDIDSLAADTWLNVWKNPAYDPEQGRFFAWLLTIAKNIAASMIRTGKFEMLKNTEVLNEEAAPPVRNPEVDSESGFAECFGKLGSACQEILRLGIDGLKDREIADKLNIPEGTVASRKSRCRQQLLDCINTQKP